MNKTFSVVMLVLILMSTIPNIQTFAEEDEKLAFVGYLEEILGHLWALEQNLDENNANLAMVHATHPIAELYDLISPELQKHDAALDLQLRQILFELKDKSTSNVTREQAQQAIDEAKIAVELVRSAVVGDEGNKMDFKINLIIGLLETSIVEYDEAVSDGQIKEMIEFQDGSAFVWRSQEIYDTIMSEVPENEAKEIAEFYEDLWNAYSINADPSEIETLAGGIIRELKVVAGMEMEVTELTDYVANIRNLLTEAKEEYAKGETTEALSLATNAYLDNYEFLESSVGTQNSELNEEVERMMREELRDMIKNGSSASEVSAHIDEILLKMDEVVVIVPEFGHMAIIVLVAGITAIMVFGMKTQKLNLALKL